MLHNGRASCISKTGQWFSIPRTLRSSVASSLERNMFVEGVLRRANDVRVNFSRRSGSTNEGRSPSPNPTSSSYVGELFLDQTTRHPTCVLCGEQLTSCSSQVHRTYGHHVSRLIVVQRAIHLIMVYMQLLPLAQTNREELKKHLQHPKLRALLDEIDFAEPPWVAGRDGMMNQLDVVAVVLRRWWRQLQSPEYPGMADAAEAPPTFNRLPSLSSSSGRERLCRLRSLLLMLKTQGVLTGLNTSSSSAMGDDIGFTRNTSFQRFEMIGDNVFKHAVPDRMRILFPDVEMHFTNVVGSMQQLIDSNSSLREMYDYLHLSHLTKANLSHSKAKADAVEALFGELQALLWSSEYNVGQVNVEVEPTRELRAIRAIVAHTLNELAHTGFMWRMEETLLRAKPVIEAFTINSKEVHWQRMWEEQAAPHAPHSSGRCMYPVLSFFPRPHPVTGHLPPGEVYSYSCAAPPQASPHHNRQRILSTTSISSTKLKTFYAAECPSKQPLWETLCNNTSLVSEMHASCIPALLPSAGSTTPREPRMSAEEAWVRVGAPSFDLF